MTQIAENIQRVREQMAEAAVRSGRTPEEIQLVGATKTQSSAVVAEAMPGLDAAGENRVQEYLAHVREGAYGAGAVDFIGHLQLNKAAKIAGKVRLIQSVDSVRCARVIGQLAEKAGGWQDILLEINVGEEASKSGFAPGAVFEAADEIRRLPGVRIRGIMAIPPISSSSAENRKVFAGLSQLFIDIKAKKYDNVTMDFLSMGMSGDFVEAILEGSNMVRVGTAIFGARR